MARTTIAAALGRDVRGSRWATALLWAAVAAAVVCLVYDLNGITQAHAFVTVPVSARSVPTRSTPSRCRGPSRTPTQGLEGTPRN